MLLKTILAIAIAVVTSIIVIQFESLIEPFSAESIALFSFVILFLLMMAIDIREWKKEKREPETTNEIEKLKLDRRKATLNFISQNMTWFYLMLMFTIIWVIRPLLGIGGD